MAERDNPTYPRTGFYSALRPLASVLFRVFFPFKVENREGLRNPRAPYLLIDNHNSNLDALVLAWLCPYELRFLGKRELIRGRFTKWLLEDKLHMIPISRSDSDINAMRACMNVLKEGNVLCVFPEGTRKLEKLMEKVEKGVALLATRQKVDMVPVYIHGKPRLFRRNRAVIGAPMRVADYPPGPYTDQKADIMCDAIRETFFKLSRMVTE